MAFQSRKRELALLFPLWTILCDYLSAQMGGGGAHTQTHRSSRCLVQSSAAIREKRDRQRSSNVTSLLRYSQLNCGLNGFRAGFPPDRKAIESCSEASLAASVSGLSEAASPSYLSQRDLLHHVSLAQSICLRRTVPLRMLWLHVLLSPVPHQQLSLGAASLRCLYLHPGLTLQLEAQGTPQINVPFPRSPSPAWNQ